MICPHWDLGTLPHKEKGLVTFVTPRSSIPVYPPSGFGVGEPKLGVGFGTGRGGAGLTGAQSDKTAEMLKKCFAPQAFLWIQYLVMEGGCELELILQRL